MKRMTKHVLHIIYFILSTLSTYTKRCLSIWDKVLVVCVFDPGCQQNMNIFDLYKYL